MLQTLRVKNLAIVENVRVDFGEGLNVITGETGAGKSIIVGALGLVLGERADKSMIRAGETQCGVEATFHLPDSAEVDVRLEALGLDPCEDGLLVVRRIVQTEGAGKVVINDAAATVQALKQLGDVLVDMHGPHDHQSLLNTDFQLDLLDAFGHLWDQRHDYETIHAAMRELASQRAELESDDQAVEQQLDMLRFQIKEIEDAELDGTSEEALRHEHATVANAQRLLELSQGVGNALTEDEHSAFNAMTFVQNAMRELADIDDTAVEWRDEAKSIAVQLQELSGALGSYAAGIEGDPGRLQWLDDRLALLHKLKRKYGQSVEEILAFRDEAQAGLTDLEHRGERIAAIDRELAKTRKELEQRGSRLREARGKAAAKLAKAITRELKALGFEHGVFDVALTACEPKASGMDDIEFGFAPNPGEPMRPLRAIASSGEISRVMLATKAVLAAHDRIPVLVFDEIDANVGGEMGNAVGTKLADVSQTHQVLCITHLPQVAVHGGAHFVVRKDVSGGRTHTRMEPVTNRERVEEVARMLGGRDLTSVTLKHAREMLAKSGQEAAEGIA